MKTPEQKSGGWFPVSKTDMETILSFGTRDGATLFSVWCSLLSIANTQKTNNVVASVSKIARSASLSYRATFNALHKLAKTEMLSIESRRGVNPGKCNREPSCYRLSTSVQPYAQSAQPLCTKDTTPYAQSAQPLCTKDTTPYAQSADSINNNKTILNNCVCTTQTHAIKSFKKWDEKDFWAKAQEANNGRLSDKELQAFCEYWTERGDGVKLMLFQRKQTFDVSRRIATWARNDFRQGKQSGDEEVCKENQRRKNELAGQLLKEIYES